ncbi:MAG: hypothetical protein LBH44_10285 [Treponema sp.]|jgi:hypothetical protein|nr:hypothetical protein [Treponema sp.]
MGWHFKPSKWLLLFLGDNEYIQTDVVTNLTLAAEFAEKNVPKYELQVLDTSKTKKIPTGIHIENEIIEEFSEKILNDLITRRKKAGAAKVALIMERNAFPSDDIFENIVRQVKHDDSIYHLICSKGNFLDAKQRKICYNISCDKCGLPFCEHSCLLRLLWVIFEDKRALTVLDSTKTKPK